MGIVKINGLFEPGTDVRLYQVPDDGTLRAAGGELIGRRIVAADGTLGFDGVDVGVRCIASGFGLNGQRLEVRCAGLHPDHGAAELGQPPVQLARQTQGTQEAPLVAAPPAEPYAILHVGIPAEQVAA